MINALEIKGLFKSYGRCRALDGLDLTVPVGSLFGLVGANGAGKTTLMSICAGLLRPDTGRVDLLGEGAFEPQRHAGRVTILPQDSRLPLHARVQDLLAGRGRVPAGPGPGPGVRLCLERQRHPRGPGLPAALADGL